LRYSLIKFVTTQCCNRTIHPSSPEREQKRSDTAGNPGSGLSGILLVPGVLATRVDAAFADVVAAAADDAGPGRRNGSEGLIALGVTESENCRMLLILI
jgi:hypothetical protein